MGLIASMILQNMHNTRADEQRQRANQAAGLLADRYFSPTEVDEDGEMIARGGLFTRAGSTQERLAVGRQFVGDALRTEATRPAALSLFSSLLGEDAQDARHSGQLQQQHSHWEQNMDRQLREDERNYRLAQQTTNASVRAARAREHAALRGAQFTGDGGFYTPGAVPGVRKVAYFQGTPKWDAAARTVGKTTSEINTVRSLLGDIRDNKWIMTPSLAGSLRIKLDRVRALWGGITGRGVLQAEEKIEIDKLLQDPTTFVRNPGGMAKLLSALQTVEGMLANDYEINTASYAHYPGMGGFFELDEFAAIAPPGGGPGPNAVTFQAPEPAFEGQGQGLTFEAAGRAAAEADMLTDTGMEEGRPGRGWRGAEIQGQRTQERNARIRARQRASLLGPSNQ